MQLDEAARTIEFPDNSGRKRILFRPRSISAMELVADVTIQLDSVDEVSGSELSLLALPFSRDRLNQLNDLLTRWLCDFSSFDLELTQSRWSRFELTVGPEPDYISSIEKPAVRVDVNWCGISAVGVMVVDQSCIRIFQEGVNEWLRLDRVTTA